MKPEAQVFTRSLLSSAVVLLFPASAALAQSISAAAQDAETGNPKVAAASDSNGAAVQSVEIRARGRKEALQNVPMSIQAFSSKAIEDAGISKPGDMVALVPNLSLSEGQSIGTSFMTIRGLSQVRNGEPPMAVVVDGVIMPDAKLFTQEMFDIQSIEVLRGPQGALYGRNASGGAILIQTKQPGNRSQGFVQAGIASGQEKSTQASLSGALIEDKLYFRLSGKYTDRGGYLDNLYLQQKADPYRDTSLRGLLKWQVNDDLVVDFRSNYVRDRAGGMNYQYQPTHLLAGCQADPANLFDFSRINPDNVSRSFCANNFGLNTRSIDEFTVKADYNLGFASLSGVASYTRLNEYVGADQFPYTASRNLPGALDGTQTQFVDIRSKSLELRLTSPTRAGLRWMAGIYGLQTDRFISSTTGKDLGMGVDYISYDPAFNSASNPTLNWFADHNDNRAYAAFGALDYDLSKQLEGSLALRYDRDERRHIIDYRQLAGLPAGCSSSNPAACTEQASYSALQPKLSLRYRSDDHSVWYASAGRGFRSGQFNQSGVGAAAAQSNPPIRGIRDSIGAEITTSVELGYKTELAGGKVDIDTAVFRSKVSNAPYFIFIGAVGAQVLVGLDEVEITGAELQANARITSGFSLNGGIGITQSKIKAYTLNPAAVGNQAPYVPNASANLGAQYRFPLMSGVQMMVRGDLILKGKQYWDPENSAARSALSLLNLRAGIEDAKGRWSATLGIQNALDKAYNSEWATGGFANPAPPRVARLDLRYNF